MRGNKYPPAHRKITAAVKGIRFEQARWHELNLMTVLPTGKKINFQGG